jgi:hypothetical protein
MTWRSNPEQNAAKGEEDGKKIYGVESTPHFYIFANKFFINYYLFCD